MALAAQHAWLAGPANGVSLLIAGLKATASPISALPEAELCASRPRAIVWGLILLAVSAGVLGAVFQEPILGLTSEHPAVIETPVAAVVFWVLIMLFTAAFAYFSTKLYLFLVKKVLGLGPQADIRVPSFLNAEVCFVLSAIILLTVFVFGLEDYYGKYSPVYFTGFLAFAVVFSRIYQASLRLKSIWSGFCIALVQVAVLSIV